MAGLRTNSLVAVGAAGFVAGHGKKFARLALPLSASSNQKIELPIAARCICSESAARFRLKIEYPLHLDR
jgi:hypothetical protein